MNFMPRMRSSDVHRSALAVTSQSGTFDSQAHRLESAWQWSMVVVALGVAALLGLFWDALQPGCSQMV